MNSVHHHVYAVGAGFPAHVPGSLYYVTSLESPNRAALMNFCPPRCLTCSSFTTCTACLSNYSLGGTPQVCNCASGQYDNGSSCASCTHPCNECSGAPTTCTSCDAGKGFTLNGSNCECASGFYDSGPALGC